MSPTCAGARSVLSETALGFQSASSSPEQFTAYIRGEIAKWAKVVKEAGIKPE